MKYLVIKDFIVKKIDKDSDTNDFITSDRRLSKFTTKFIGKTSGINLWGYNYSYINNEIINNISTIKENMIKNYRLFLSDRIKEELSIQGVSEDKVKTEYLEYLTSPLSESKEKKIAFLKFNKIRKEVLSLYNDEYKELKDFIKKLK